MLDLDFIKKELNILEFWRQNNIFEQSIKNREGHPDFIFYEGPPTANGRPGIHHVLARSFKDIICRYKTMRGFRVMRKAGWDTHGLPVELEVEKKLGFKNKNDIEKYGISKFNQKAKESVWEYKEEWEKLTERMAYWIDTKNPYITFDNNYIETIWWLLKKTNEKGLLYKSYKVLPYCPRCGTPLSSHEVAQGYETVQDPSIYIKFQILEPPSSILDQLKIKNLELKIFLLVWTTTPWTLIANVAIAVDKNLDYKIFKVNDEYLISYKELPDNQGELVGTIKGEDLIGLEYKPLYEVPNNLIVSDGKRYQVVGANFISTEEGTGLVHIAPAFGEDDMNLKNQENLSMIKHVDDKGYIIDAPQEVIEVKGKFFKDADEIIFNDLKNRNILYWGDLKGTTHEYPFCWRCHTPLLYFAFEAWYIKMSQLKENLIKNNELINWVPEHIKEGRFGQWLKDIKDWAISRNRYWGTPLPVWECKSCGHYEVIGSLKELEEKSVNHELPYDENHNLDLHRPFIDKITLKCPQCGNIMTRREEVLDCWFDSGAMPYAQYHFPFEQFDHQEKDVKEMIKSIPFPADFISEAIDQTRGWFYTLLAIATILDLGPSYKNVICLGLILDAKGEKMSKSRGNVVDPMKIMDEYGADALRWYLYTINSPGEEKRFNENDLVNVTRRFLNTLWNVFVFYKTYADKESEEFSKEELNVLNRWILARLEETKQNVMNNLDAYHVYEAAKELDLFVDDLSRWYLRRSRRVFQKPDDLKELKISSAVLKKVLKDFSLILAPFCPFISENLWQELRKQEEPISVHLGDYPQENKDFEDKDLIRLMNEAREVTANALSLRQKFNIKVRQPLNSLKINQEGLEIQNYPQLLDIIKEEINVKNIIFDNSLKEPMELDTNITPELKEEGDLRELVRQIQEIRKALKLTPQDRIALNFFTDNEEIKEFLTKKSEIIQKETLANELNLLEQKPEDAQEISIDDKKIFVSFKK
jgi:isoleucyl-tRNA synthetase